MEEIKSEDEMKVIENLMDQLVLGVEVIISISTENESEENTEITENEINVVEQKSRMQDSSTSMSQEFCNKSQLSRNEKLDVSSSSTASGLVEMVDADTAMSQEFLLQSQIPINDKLDASTTSYDLVEKIDAETAMSQEFLKLQNPGINQLDLDVPTTSFDPESAFNSDFALEDGSEFKTKSTLFQIVPLTSGINTGEDEIVDDDDFYSSKKQKFHDHRYESDMDHLVPAGTADDEKDKVARENLEPVFRKQFTSRNFDEAIGFENMESSNKFKKIARLYEYCEDDDKENLFPGNASTPDKGTNMDERNFNFESHDSAPVSPTISSGIHLRLGLSRRRKPLKSLHNLTSRRL